MAIKLEYLVVGIMVIIDMLWLVQAKNGAAIPIAMAKEGCIDRCGNITIPYPFGIGPNCYANKTFEITCNNTSKPLLTSIYNLEVLYIYLGSNSKSPWIEVNYPITRSDGCPAPTRKSYLDLSGTPFSFSQNTNIFVGVGCNLVAQMLSPMPPAVEAQCTSICSNGSSSTNTNWGRYGTCYGINCCQTPVPPSLKAVNVSLASISTSSTSSGDHECKYGFLVDQDWFSFGLPPPYDVEAMESVPVNLIWKADEMCYGTKLNRNATEYEDGIWGADCYCENYPLTGGNPYLHNGCSVDGKVCAGLTEMQCDKDNKICANICIVPKSNRTVKFVFTGLGSGLGGLFMIMGAWMMRKVIKRRNTARLKKKFFKRNGGLLLQKQLCSAEQVYVEKTKLFSSKELETATDHYNENRVLGRGGQGTVYKGMLSDGKIIAVKKAKLVDEKKVEEFINEVVILSQINHRNVVKLHACCLETEVPMLVYDFIPNGTLFQYIHDHQENEDFPLTWAVRLRIASEVAGALSYLHSAASLPIYHRDIKSSNILLNDKYRAKVADFGTSRSAAVDQTHMTTRVHGTIGYLDPEYYQSSQFTAKSDVYSFGVVLVELLTGQKAVLPITFMEGRSLVTYFLSSIKENRLFDILDAQVLKEGREGEIVGVANLANRCLNLNGRKRPTMKEVATELEAIETTHSGSSHFQQHDEEVDDYGITQLAGPFDCTASTSMTPFIGR